MEAKICDPVTAIGFGLSAAGQVAGFAGEQQATNEYNRAAARNRMNALLAANRQYEDIDRSFIYDTTKDRMEAFDTVMDARRGAATVRASGGSAGFDASSLTLGDLLSEYDREAGETDARFALKLDDRKMARSSKVESVRAEAEGRINSMPYKSGPSPLALGLGIANAGLSAVKGTKQGKIWMGIQ